MLSADLLYAARQRAGLTQRELATRAGKPQSSIARWERGAMHPSLETLRELLRACGFDLWYQLANVDDSYAEFIDRALDLEPLERLNDAVARERIYEKMRRAAAA
jgi:transcriptional regulator with XRE-family HTH domain